MQPENVALTSCKVGEAPLWHPDEGKLYWVDAGLGVLRRFCPVMGLTELCAEGLQASGLTLQANGALLLFTRAGEIKTWWDGKVHIVREKAVDGPFNDVIADPLGRVFAGVVATDERPGRVVRVERDASVHVVMDGMLQPNGMAFSPDRTKLYVTDTHRREIYQLDYNAGTGDISNQTVLIRVAEDDGMPDGLTVDAGGFLWSAHWNGSCVVRYSPDGEEVLRIEFPVKKPSSVTFGGVDYMSLYISSAVGDDWVDDSREAGSLFRLDPGVRGLPEFWSRVGL